MTAPTAGLPVAPVSPVFRQRGRTTAAIGWWLAVGWLALIVLSSVFAGVLPLSDPNGVGDFAPLLPPSFEHLLGTDQLGRDMVPRIIIGARTSLGVGIGATLISGVLGTLVGLVSGYVGRAVDAVVMTLVDVLLSFPALIFAIALTSFLGPSVTNVVIAISVLAFPSFVRISRAQAMSVARRDFVTAARVTGVRPARILLGEVAPNVLPTVLAYALVIIAAAIVVEAALSFIGLGVPQDVPTWGAMIASGKPVLAVASHVSLVPAAFLFFTVLALNALGERFRERVGGMPG